ncbi:MAG: hypothetical protein ACKOYC_08000 [Bacteroidota bacterium]
MELLITVLFLAFFLWLAFRQSKKTDVGLPVWAPTVFLATKFIVGYAVFLIFTFHYPDRNDADIFKYYDDAMVLFNYMKQDHTSILPIMLKSDIPVELSPRMRSWFSGSGFNLFDSSQAMVKIHVLIRLVSFGSYHVHSFFFCFLSFAGCMYLLRSIRLVFEVNPWFLLACFCFPSFLLWSSAPLKESVAVCLIMISFAGAIWYFVNGSSRHLAFSLLAISSLYVIKPFYVLVFLSCMVIVWINKSGSTRSLLFHVFLVVGLVWLCDLMLPDYSPIDMLARKQKDYFDHFNWQSARSMSEIPALQPDISGLIKLFPNVLVNVFLKPFPWESVNVLYLASSIENLLIVALLSVTILRFHKSKNVAVRRVVLLMLSFFFVTYFVLGFSCPVIGTLMRFKSPALVFVPLAFMLVSPFFKIALPIRTANVKVREDQKRSDQQGQNN